MPALRAVNIEGLLPRVSGTFAAMSGADCTLKHWGDWLRWAEFLSSCPHLDGLSVYQSRFMKKVENFSLTSSSLLSLRNLYISISPCYIDFSATDNLLQSLSAANLTSITLDIYRPKYCAALCEILVSSYMCKAMIHKEIYKFRTRLIIKL